MSNARDRPSAPTSAVARVIDAAGLPVSFEIMHVAGDQGRFERGRPIGVKGLFAGEPPFSREILCFEVPGVRFIIRTWSSNEPHVAAAGTSVEGSDVSRGNIQEHSCRGTVMPDLNLLNGSDHSVEMLLTLKREPWTPIYTDSLILACVTGNLASIITEVAKVPVTFFQSPASPYRDPIILNDEGLIGEEPSLARTLAVRFAVGVESSSVHRLKMLTDVAKFAAEFGMGLQIADRRLGRVRGEWWTIFEPEGISAYEHQKSKRFRWCPTEVPASARLLTFVGPARVGALVEVVHRLRSWNDVELLAITMSTLQEIAFISVVVAVTSGDGRHLLVNRTGCAIQEPRKTEGCELNISDYHLFSTGPVPLSTVDRTGSFEWSLWVSWELEPYSKSNPEVVECLLRRLRGERVEMKEVSEPCRCLDAGMEYYRARLHGFSP